MKRRNIIIWGFAHEYHQQASGNPIASHAYIHAGYVRAFRAMGCDVDWVDDVPGAAALVQAEDLVEYIADRLNNLGFLGIANCVTRLFKRLAEKIQVTVT